MIGLRGVEDILGFMCRDWHKGSCVGVDCSILRSFHVKLHRGAVKPFQQDCDQNSMAGLVPHTNNCPTNYYEYHLSECISLAVHVQ